MSKLKHRYPRLPTRRGKIARLPYSIREEINRRLRNGHLASEIATWLNSLNAVRTIMAAQFGGTTISENNLSVWRLGGYQDWLRQRP